MRRCRRAVISRSGRAASRAEAALAPPVDCFAPGHPCVPASIDRGVIEPCAHPAGLPHPRRRAFVASDPRGSLRRARS